MIILGTGPIAHRTALAIDDTGVTHSFAPAQAAPTTSLGTPPSLIHMHNVGSSDIFWKENSGHAAIVTSGATADKRLRAGMAIDLGVLNPTTIAFKCDTSASSTLDVWYRG